MKGKGRLRVQERNGQDAHDAYWNKAHPKDQAHCRQCRAIYHNKHWFFDEEKLQQLTKAKQSEAVLCPACEKIRDRFASGFVKLSGSFLSSHRQEILNLLRNEEKRAMGLNPLERIIEIEGNGHGLLVSTTHEKLAQRLGKSLQRAFSGEVEYHWSRGEKMARVSWNRD